MDKLRYQITIEKLSLRLMIVVEDMQLGLIILKEVIFGLVLLLGIEMMLLILELLFNSMQIKIKCKNL